MRDHAPGESFLNHAAQTIQLRGVRVHNLKNIDLDIPLRQIVSLCGVSGSGKTSLAFDTLYAEGQRRYLETLSPSARQFLHQFPRPDADQVHHIPPTVALRQNAGEHRTFSKGIEHTVGIETGIQNFLRLLYASAGQVICPQCELSVSPQSPESVLPFIRTLPEKIRFQICFPLHSTPEQPATELLAELTRQGLTRAIIDHATCKLNDLSTEFQDGSELLIVLDRLRTPPQETQRILESLELAFEETEGPVVLLVEHLPDDPQAGAPFSVDGQPWFRFDFFEDLTCPQCRQTFQQPEPQLFNFFSQTGACPLCLGSGLDPAADSSNGIDCPDCLGSRLNPAALAVQLAGVNIHQLTQRSIHDLNSWLEQLQPDPALSSLIREISHRLHTMTELGIDYLTLNRRRSTLSSGELQRIALTSVLSSNLVNTLYVLDEPSAGLHPADNQRVISILHKIRDLNNSLVIVEHEADFIRAADQIIELGPGAGRAGGELVFQGTCAELLAETDSPTGQSLRAATSTTWKPLSEQPASGRLTLSGLTRNNLKGITVAFPLGQLSVVTGVSGSGKSSLVEQTLFPLLTELLTENAESVTDSHCQTIEGFEQIDEVVLLNQTLAGQTPRSIPATYLNLFDEIRTIFAQTADAKLRNLSSRDFSFNSKNGGRCPECKGTGFVDIDLQFLADLTMVCPACHGQRYQRELLEIKYRKLNIAEVLEMTVDEAFPFFRGQASLQKKLKQLKDVGLGYLPLGQPLPSLSGGEYQRLKLAAYLTTSSRKQTLFLMNEPSRGLHPQDIQYLLNCFTYLLTAGHSLILVEHNLQLIRAANLVIDLGPEAGAKGGEVVVAGTPAEVAQHPVSLTGAALQKLVAHANGN